jgi:heptaprenyl diphosphate synthase
LVALTGLLFAIAVVLAAIEGALPPVVAAAPGVKLGLSNVAVMYALFFLKKRQAFAIAILKSAFVFGTRGLIAGILSLSGGILSLAVMILLIAVFREKVSYLILSVSGAVFHNLGQFAAISALYRNLYLWGYFPVLLVSGVAAGVATAALLRRLLPALEKLRR